jgi:hypothetical protein
MKYRAVPALLTLSLCLTSLSAQTVTPQGEEQPNDAQTPTAQIYGSVTGDLYTSPTGVFQIRIPVLPQLGGTITDTANVVTFDDDFTTHTSVGAFPLSRELKWEYDTRGTRDFLIYFFTTLVMPDFVSRFQGARMEDNGLYLPKFQDGSMLIFTLLPGGSFFAQRAILFTPTQPLVAKRGNLCFVKYNHVFMVSIELAERVLERSTYHLTVEEENQILRKRLMDVVNRMQFIKPPEAKD